MALIWPLPVTVPHFLVGYVCLTFRSCWSGVPAGFRVKKTGSILSIDFSLSLKLMLYSFQPANQSECRRIILHWATHLQQGCTEKAWKLSERGGTSRNPVHFLFFVLLPMHITRSHFLSCSTQCRVSLMVGTTRAQVVSLLQIFFRSIYLSASDGHFADDTNQYWLVDGSKPT